MELLEQALVHLSEMFQHHAMHKYVTITNFLQKDELSSVIEEASIVPGNITIPPKDEVLNTGFTTPKYQPKYQPKI